MNDDADKSLKERERYIKAFNDTMVQIWKEKIVLLGAVDSGSLKDSVVGVRMNADAKFTSVELVQSFNEYGFYVDAGTGKEIPKGNPGDIGRDKAREPKPWFFRKYMASFFNLRDFMAGSVAVDVANSVSNALTRDISRRFAINN